MQSVATQRRVDYSKAGTDVSVEIVFYKVEDVSVATGRLSLKCWLRMEWEDLRLTWDPEQFGGITQIPVLGFSYAQVCPGVCGACVAQRSCVRSEPTRSVHVCIDPMAQRWRSVHVLGVLGVL